MKKQQTKLFHEYLQRKGVGEPSQNIPAEYNRYKHGYFEEDLYQIPNNEEFPLESRDEPQIIDTKEILSLFLKSQIELLAKNKERIEIFGTRVDIPGTFKSENEFLLYKKDCSTLINFMNQEEGTDFQICEENLCCNIAVPSFHYCTRHLYLDHLFKSQNFIHNCSNPGCKIITGIGSDNCTLHRNVK